MLLIVIVISFINFSKKVKFGFVYKSIWILEEKYNRQVVVDFCYPILFQISIIQI